MAANACPLINMSDDIEPFSTTAVESLTEVTIHGFTVYVSEQTQDAYVEFEDQLVSMTDLRAWNRLMELGKQEVLDGYDAEQSFEEKELERVTDNAASKMITLADEMYSEARKIREITE
jgi:hypothetical protein